jgi:hypothetical protein
MDPADAGGPGSVEGGQTRPGSKSPEPAKPGCASQWPAEPGYAKAGMAKPGLAEERRALGAPVGACPVDGRNYGTTVHLGRGGVHPQPASSFAPHTATQAICPSA